jgi:hypothetical protein
LHEPIGQHEMPTAQHGGDANHVRPALLAPHVVALDRRQQLARARQQRPSRDAAQLAFEFRPDRRGVAVDVDAVRWRRFRAGVQMHANRLQQRRGIFAVARQRPVRFVQPAMAVAIEKPLELAEERRAGQRRPHLGQASVGM